MCIIKYLGVIKIFDEWLCIGSMCIYWEDMSREGCDYLCFVLIKLWVDGFCFYYIIDSIDI